jgi:hypothetical protein
MSPTAKRRSVRVLAVSVVLLGLTALWVRHYVKTHPLVFNESFWGHEHCIKGIGLSLQLYAMEHGGRFPSHTNGYGDALLLLSNEVNHCWALLTGPGYSGEVFGKAAATGQDVLESECGRVYVQGLSQSENPEIVLLFDKVPTPGGDHCHGLARLKAPLVREVWTIGDGMSKVRESNWPAFARKQIELLVEAGLSRREAERLYAAPAVEKESGSPR